MLLAVDIGNTNIHVGIFKENKLVYKFNISSDRSRTEDEIAALFSTLAQAGGVSLQSADGIIIGSVVPALTEKLKAVLRRLTSLTPTVVGPGIKSGFNIKIDDPSELGADLAANTAAVIDAFGAPAVSVDFGTVTVISVIDQSGAYIGGTIMPGIQMSLDAMQNTGMLPDVYDINVIPPIGKNSKDCMRSGVLLGQAISVCGFIENYKKDILVTDELPIIVSGGFAPKMLAFLPQNAVHCPDLTLMGLKRIYEINNRKKR